MKKFTMLFFMIFIAASLFIVNGCDALNSDKDDDDPNNPTTTNAGNILGTVKSTWNSGIGGVTVKVNNLTTTTNDQGWFTLPEVPPGTRVQVKFELNGYVSTSEIVNVVVGQSTFIEVVMATAGTPQTITNSGGTVTTNDGATVTFGQNAFSNNGTATVEATYFDPTTSYFTAAFPGDFTGLQNGQEGALESYGFIDVNLKDANGNPLNLRSGQTAEIRIPIPYALQSTAPNTIPLWYYDETAGIWKSEGTGTRSGNEYVGVVSHFTSWNWDVYYDVAYIYGRVVDGDGNPVNHAYVTADGVTYSGRSYRYTGSDGTFRMGVKPNSQVTVKASKGGVSSSTLTIYTPANGQEQNLGDIVLAAPWATITLTWGSDPRDLDSHLLVPPSTTGGTGGHVAYYSKGSQTTYPYAELDTDDTQSYGPENVTVVRKFQGVYKYYVHWYSGSANLPSSGAKITLLLSGNLYTFNIPTTGSIEHRYWHVFNMTVGNNGNVSLQTVNQIMEDAPTAEGYSLMKITPPAK